MKNRLLILALTATLTGCAGAPAAADHMSATAEAAATGFGMAGSMTSVPAAEESPAAQVSAAAETTAAAGSSLSLDDAKAMFAETHPNIPIEVAKQEGDVYYIQGYESSKIYKMKIGVDSGTIYLDKIITTGRR